MSVPKLFDFNTKDLPFYYNQEVKVQVTQPNFGRLLSLLELKRVEKFEITADKRGFSSVLLTVINEDSQQTIEIDFKPRFKLIFKGNFTL
ncbi:hypothetical protein COC46_02095 [Bacillus sp. AFS041924]|nr:hypothetical protein COC46_02095 [Bacillus sp. AFS041924]